MLTCTTIWNYAHFYIDTHFDHSMLSRNFTLGSDLFYMRAVFLILKLLVSGVG